MDASLARKVREREGHACEYCRMPQAYDPAVPFPIDHVIARQHGGPTTPGNLALSCLHDLAYALSPEVVSQPARRSDGGPPKPMDSLPWLHKVILVEEVKDPQGRLWYAHKALEHGWSRAVLDHHIDTGLCRRQGKASSTFSIPCRRPDPIWPSRC